MSDARRLHEILRVVSMVYHHNLTRGGSGADLARAYLRRRWVFPHAIDAWRLGWAPAQNNGGKPWILQRMESNASIAELKEAGVLIETERGLSDPMAGRVVFPQTVPSGQVAGFVGRVITGAHPSKDKYLATPQTEVFRRSEILYRMDMARQAVGLRDQIVVVEGLLDAVLMWQVGARHVVATGTAGMTDAQAQIAARYARKLGIMFDADEVGRDGTDRVRSSVGTYFAKVELVPLPKGASDPARWAEIQMAQRISG